MDIKLINFLINLFDKTLFFKINNVIWRISLLWLAEILILARLIFLQRINTVINGRMCVSWKFSFSFHSAGFPWRRTGLFSDLLLAARAFCRPRVLPVQPAKPPAARFPSCLSLVSPFSRPLLNSPSLAFEKFPAAKNFQFCSQDSTPPNWTVLAVLENQNRRF